MQAYLIMSGFRFDQRSSYPYNAFFPPVAIARQAGDHPVPMR
jgi:hypothetical protein